jgi:iron(III) transport system substrate-binding protein
MPHRPDPQTRRGSIIARLARLTAATLPVLALALSGATRANEVNVYSARHYDSDTALYAAFTAETGVKVNVLQGDSDQLIARIQREGSASPADVLLTVDVARLWRAEAAGVLDPVQSEILEARIPAHLRHPDDLWFAFSTRSRLIFYRPGSIDPATIQTYESLADPAHRGKLCIRSSTNPYNQSLIASMIAAHGAEATETWARGLVANLARPPQGGDTDQLKALAAGECDIAVANHYYYVRMTVSADVAEREMAGRLAVIAPNQADRGTHVNVGGAGVVRGAPNRANAIRFLEYLASDAAQALFAGGNYEFPVVAGAQLVAELEPLKDIRTDPLNVSELGRHNAEAVRIADRAGWR